MGKGRDKRKAAKRRKDRAEGIISRHKIGKLGEVIIRRPAPTPVGYAPNPARGPGWLTKRKHHTREELSDD